MHRPLALPIEFHLGSNSSTYVLHISHPASVRAIHYAARTAHGDMLDFDQLNALPFLDAVMRETLRWFALPSILLRLLMRRAASRR